MFGRKLTFNQKKKYIYIYITQILKYDSKQM